MAPIWHWPVGHWLLVNSTFHTCISCVVAGITTIIPHDIVHFVEFIVSYSIEFATVQDKLFRLGSLEEYCTFVRNLYCVLCVFH